MAQIEQRTRGGYLWCKHQQFPRVGAIHKAQLEQDTVCFSIPSLQKNSTCEQT